ncbi:hypothetical protein H2200_001023 [Cladophialophora chaetospira]|uniref:DUF1398 domain-containing protein n=1 Tax=Cladophialophora chaetospira TaxID=386627 RepID=A0AA38XPN9_9EURO|nr:hypothetical protein H2200_001023 [Cladophialophora chaetospira]
MLTLSPIAKVFAQVHSPDLPFPKTVAALLALGVTRYHIDYASSLATAFSQNIASGTTSTEQIPVPTPRSIPNGKWDPSGVKNAIKRVQSGQTPTYDDFSQEIIQAGVVGYFAFLTGKKVVYYGAEGDLHVEWFPGAGPKQED